MDAAGTDPRTRMRAMGRAYVGFARARPGLFLLMFRGARDGVVVAGARICDAAARRAAAEYTLVAVGR
jgi:hypothetical protein